MGYINPVGFISLREDKDMIKATWENIELTEKAHSVNSDLETWKTCGWLPEQLVEHSLARITQPVFIDGAEYFIRPLRNLGYPTNQVRFKYELKTNRFIAADRSWLNASDFGTRFTVELVQTENENVKSGSHTETVKTVNRATPRNKYDREILPGVHVDVYDVLEAFNPHSKAIDHAVKKLLCPGQRGVKDRITDLEEAMSSIQREIDRLGEWGDK